MFIIKCFLEFSLLTFVCVFFIFISRKSVQADLYKMLFIAILVKLFFFISINAFLFQFTESFAFEDDKDYYEVSQKIAKSWKKSSREEPGILLYQRIYNVSIWR